MRFRRKPKQQEKKTDVYAFIDSQNLNLGIQRAGWKMDWRKFRQFLENKYGVTKAYMFIGYVSENEDMYNQLHEAGYLIVLKPTVESSASSDDKQAKPMIKGNIDAELVLYAMKEMPNYAKAIIVSGDGDFYCLAEYLESKSRLKHIMTPNWKYSSLLKPYEKYVIRLDQRRKELEHIDYRPKTKASKKLK
ncbi:NYN domain-containing protein [Candidatus Saccharibacteria bacterium]|nr:NYN domain-containing protein [Candidatus Saccharibacteria bacterium]